MRLRPLLLLPLAFPAGASDLRDALDATRWTLDARLRHEHVHDAAFARDANALTLRIRAGLATGTWHGLSAFVEGEAVRALGDGRFDSTANGDARYPVVADPDASEINQAGLRWQRDGIDLAAGRQRIVYDHARFIGDVGFRQNQQTYDAVAASYARGPWTFRAAWLDEVHRVFGEDHPNPLSAEQDLDARLLNISRAVGPATAVAYHYDVENQDLSNASSRTIGARVSGAHAFDASQKLLYTVELARQGDTARAPSRDAQGYALGEIGYGFGPHAVKAGVERLGGDGTVAFQTPLATLHAFNGWADQFLVTPANGLVDRYVTVGGKLWGGDYAIFVRDFDSDRGSIDYGREYDAVYRRGFAKHFEWEVKFADYRAEEFSRDVRKAWFSITARY